MMPLTGSVRWTQECLPEKKILGFCKDISDFLTMTVLEEELWEN